MLATHSLTAAASAAVASLIHGPRIVGAVVAATSDLVAVQVRPDDGVDPTVVCVTGPDAVRLPCALVLPEPLVPPPVGTPATVGGGQLALGDPGVAVSVARWWPASPPVIDDVPLAVARAMVCPAPPLDTVVHDEAEALVAALAGTGDRLDAAVRRLLGLGPGLTPAGDDVLAGALVTLHAVGTPAGVQLAAAVRRAGPFQRTGTLSAGLLGYAARGMGVPPLDRMLSTFGAPDGDVDRAVRDLVAVGHTSGAAMLLGALVGLRGLPGVPS